MRLIVPAPPDVGTMRRQATSSNPASLIQSAAATSSSSSSSPVNIVNYRRLYNECDGSPLPPSAMGSINLSTVVKEAEEMLMVFTSGAVVGRRGHQFKDGELWSREDSSRLPAI
ncbi:hypothetical protein OUZ56_000120 [Daphnia magna]|uniref:Uncharacterized protein n=1 Tax=Daphnia magna TaxID=35525 RepID=A0ABQ9ZYS1_9CRUS|nr:hypothetical protein OUZ56_000120 [Daphnia magna]